MIKRNLNILLFLICFVLILTACSGDKEVTDIIITGGLKTEYSLGETPDFSSVTANVFYNDGTSKAVTGKELSFGNIDTNIIGDRELTISYGGYKTSINVTVKGNSFDNTDPTGQIITSTSLPESLALWSINKKDFINKDRPYIVGDDNPFFFTLKLSVYSTDGEKLDVTSYVSSSNVYLENYDEPLFGEERAKYVLIDEEKNSFDFTDDAVGKTFTIKTRPRDGVDGVEEEMSKSITVKIVDGYNIYKAYELNFLTNSSNINFSSLHSGEERDQVEIVNDFLMNSFGVTRPDDFSGIVLHGNLNVSKNDIPAEYFLDKDRTKDFFDYLSVFHFALSDAIPSFDFYGNFFAIYASELPPVVAPGYGNQDDNFASAQLFRFTTVKDVNEDYDHSTQVLNITDLMLIGSDPQSDKLEGSDIAMRGISAIKTCSLTANITNVNIQSFYISYFADYDYHTANITDCVFNSAFQNHIFALSSYALPAELKDKRLTINIKRSIIKSCGGPAIITQNKIPESESGFVTGVAVNISKDSVVESWVTGEEAWFKAMGITVVAEQIKKYEPMLNKHNSSFITEKIVIIDSKETKLKLMNVIMVNLMFPENAGSMDEIFNMMMGNTDIDGKLTIGGSTVMDMDDTETGKYGNASASEIKGQSMGNHVFETSNGVGYTAPGTKFTVTEGDISAKTPNDYLSIYFYTLGIVLGNYHPI